MIYLLHNTRSPGKVKGANLSPPEDARAKEDELENVQSKVVFIYLNNE